MRPRCRCAGQEKPCYGDRAFETTGPGIARWLARAGFKLDFGDGNTGWQFKYLTRGGGYYSMSAAPI